MNSPEPENHSSEDSLPTRIAAVPLVLDDNPLDVDDDEDPEDLEDLEEVIIRHRITTARSLFHKPRGDDDTMLVLRYAPLTTHPTSLTLRQEFYTVHVRFGYCIYDDTWSTVLWGLLYTQR
jgi:hypothetical protein